MPDETAEQVIATLLKQTNELDDTIEFYTNRSQMLLFAIRTGLRKLQAIQNRGSE